MERLLADVGPSFVLFKPPIFDTQKGETPGKIGTLDPGEEYFATYNRSSKVWFRADESRAELEAVAKSV